MYNFIFFNSNASLWKASSDVIIFLFLIVFKPQKLPEKSCKDEPRGYWQIAVLLTVIFFIYSFILLFFAISAWQKGRASIIITSRNGKLTAATLRSLTGTSCATRITRFFVVIIRQGLVDSCTDGLGSVCLSLFFAPFSSFLISLLLRYCFFFPVMASRSPEQKWRLMPPFSSLI